MGKESSKWITKLLSRRELNKNSFLIPTTSFTHLHTPFFFLFLFKTYQKDQLKLVPSGMGFVVQCFIGDVGKLLTVSVRVKAD